ncbi:hypothetical protein OPT61_g9298 [Boeremia exigua]|uniref:Uncharacterized protein n=1 Tax=Boeremia exigua TaxID=749465 RepID=A0ACC2HVA5_9PLEO|nr:hypothetical protein OPT61_g9298 [Boeremia exigua]
MGGDGGEGSGEGSGDAGAEGRGGVRAEGLHSDGALPEGVLPNTPLPDGAHPSVDPPDVTPEVVLLDARQLCSGATGHNGGHIKVQVRTLLNLADSAHDGGAAHSTVFVSNYIRPAPQRASLTLFLTLYAPTAARTSDGLGGMSEEAGARGEGEGDVSLGGGEAVDEETVDEETVDEETVDEEAAAEGVNEGAEESGVGCSTADVEGSSTTNDELGTSGLGLGLRTSDVGITSVDDDEGTSAVGVDTAGALLDAADDDEGVATADEIVADDEVTTALEALNPTAGNTPVTAGGAGVAGDEARGGGEGVAAIAFYSDVSRDSVRDEGGGEGEKNGWMGQRR